MSKKVLVVLADGFEDIEVVAPIDILTRAGAHVTIASLKGGVVKGAWGTSLVSDIPLSQVRNDCDAIVLPGGLENALALATAVPLLDMIRKMDADGKLVAAICASPACVLGEAAGLLSNKRACGYRGFNDRLVACGATVVEQQVVVDQNIITAVGPAAAIQFGLKIVEYLLGRSVAQKIADQWDVSF